MRILLTGATGFIGRRLCQLLQRRKARVVALTRDPLSGMRLLDGHARAIGWDPPANGPWVDEIAQVDTVVNLAGEPIFGRWTEAHKKRIYDSRILATRALVDAIVAAPAKPKRLVQISAIGYYGETVDEVDESSPPGSDFLARLCVDWEGEAKRAEALGVEVVIARMGVVLGRAWDHFAVAWPFARVVVTLGAPIEPSSDDDAASRILEDAIGRANAHAAA